VGGRTFASAWALHLAFGLEQLLAAAPPFVPFADICCRAICARLRVTVAAATAEPGAVVLLAIEAGSARISAPCRVVCVITQPCRHAFAHGTLPGHPESGEEASIIEQRAEGIVEFTITACSRPATAMARAAGPLGRLAQLHYTRRYLRALAESHRS
jgi:uncharacterized protein (UPF0548 family)